MRPFVSNPNCSLSDPLLLVRLDGITIAFNIKTITPISAVNTNEACHSKCCPTKVPIGTPSTLATPKPPKMYETDLPWFAGVMTSLTADNESEIASPHRMAVIIRVIINRM
ncbi:hypothetical protein D3C81_2085980 [compost metagenome]